MRTNIDGGRKALLTIGAGGLVVAAAYFAAGLFVNPPGLSNGSGAQALAAIAANAGSSAWEPCSTGPSRW